MDDSRYNEMIYITSVVKENIKKIINAKDVDQMPTGLSHNFMFLYEQRLHSDIWLRPYVCAMLLKQYGYLYDNSHINVDIIPALMAAEIFNISTYQSNIVFDDKINNKSVRNVNQIISSFISLNLASILLSELHIDAPSKVECINKLNYNNNLVYQGQYIDLNILTTDNFETITQMSYEQYIDLYMKRCELIGGTTVENCAYWACKIANITDINYIETICRLFRTWGQMMQMVNDLSDFAYIIDRKYIRYTDVRAGKITLPLYLILKSGGKDVANEIMNNIPIRDDHDLYLIFKKYLYKDSHVIQCIYAIMREKWTECNTLITGLQLDKKIFSFMFENAFLTKYSRFFFSNRLIDKKNGKLNL